MPKLTIIGTDRCVTGLAIVAIAVCAMVAPAQAVPMSANTQVVVTDPQREVFKDPYSAAIYNLGSPSMSAASAGAGVVGAGSSFGGGGGGGGGFFGGGGGNTSFNSSTVGASNPANTTYWITDPKGVSLAKDSLIAAAAAAAASVPEGGATIIMLGCGLLTLFLFRRQLGRLVAR